MSWIKDAMDKARAAQANAADWVCDCGVVAQPMDSSWRWNGRDWEHNHGGQGGHFRATRWKRVALLDGYGEFSEWHLLLESPDGESFKELAWGPAWPESVTADFLSSQGYEVRRA